MQPTRILLILRTHQTKMLISHISPNKHHLAIVNENYYEIESEGWEWISILCMCSKCKLSLRLSWYTFVMKLQFVEWKLFALFDSNLQKVQRIKFIDIRHLIICYENFSTYQQCTICFSVMMRIIHRLTVLTWLKMMKWLYYRDESMLFLFDIDTLFDHNHQLQVSLSIADVYLKIYQSLLIEVPSLGGI